MVLICIRHIISYPVFEKEKNTRQWQKHKYNDIWESMKHLLLSKQEVANGKGKQTQWNIQTKYRLRQ